MKEAEKQLLILLVVYELWRVVLFMKIIKRENKIILKKFNSYYFLPICVSPADTVL